MTETARTGILEFTILQAYHVVGVMTGRTVAFLLAAVVSTMPSYGHQPGKMEPRKKKLSVADIAALRELIAIADKTMKGDFAGADASLRWSHHFLRAPDGRTYVPFTIEIRGAPAEMFRSVAIYVRVATRGDRLTSAQRDVRVGPTGRGPISEIFREGGEGPSGASAALRLHDRPDTRSAGPYPFEDAAFIKTQLEPRLFRRAITVVAGSYDVYVTIRERQSSSARRGKLPGKVVLKRELDVPDLSKPELATSSLIVTERIEPLRRPLSPDEQAERPYALGAAEMVPALGTTLRQSDSLSAVFVVYNAAADTRGKPDVSVSYVFHHRAAGGEYRMNETAPQRFKAESLPPGFDPRAGHQLVPTQSVPLNAFPPGDYRLEVRVTDHIASRTVTSHLSFTVVP